MDLAFTVILTDNVYLESIMKPATEQALKNAIKLDRLDRSVEAEKFIKLSWRPGLNMPRQITIMAYSFYQRQNISQRFCYLRLLLKQTPLLVNFGQVILTPRY